MVGTMLPKRLKWWMRDFWMLLTARSGREEPKTVHLIFCRICDGYHPVRVKVHYVGAVNESETPSYETPYPAGKKRCPKTAEAFYAAADDWLHLTERQYDLLSKKP